MKENADQFGAVLLAAGASSRMGRPKLLLPWNGTTVLHHIIEQWQCVGAEQIVVVITADNEAIGAELDRIAFPKQQRVVNVQPERGMFSSIQAAAQWNGWDSGLAHIVIALGDQPHLREHSLQALTTFAAANPMKICQPSRAGRPRHPVVLPRGLFDELARTGHKTLKEFLEAHAGSRASVELDDPGLDLDLDTPADYEAALHLQSLRGERH